MSSYQDRIEARKSSIHGRGLYALRRFRRGAHIGTFEGVETQRDGTHVLWLTDEHGNETGVEGRNDLRFLNHASRPNAEFRGLELHALANIQPEQEITIHYGEAWDDLD